MRPILSISLLSLCFLLHLGCNPDSDTPSDESVYTGTASVSQGLAMTTVGNLYPDGGRVAGLGTITSSDNSTWTVPAEVNFDDASFPFAPDLYNPDGTQFTSAATALASFDPNDIVEIDPGGDLITAYIFADNYFELYVNGVPVGKDAIPFTGFNSHILQFRVNAPYTLAMKLVDWEEHLGLGTESGGGSAYHAGDGGMVAVFKDESDNTVAVTGADWKAQTFYTAPIKDLSCPTENGSTRSTANCDTDDSSDGSEFFALHWPLDANWMAADFDDSGWPAASTFTNATIGVDNKPSYTNFTVVFDDSGDDAQFIWSSNVILDNLVIVRYTVE